MRIYKLCKSGKCCCIILRPCIATERASQTVADAVMRSLMLECLHRRSGGTLTRGPLCWLEIPCAVTALGLKQSRSRDVESKPLPLPLVPSVRERVPNSAWQRPLLPLCRWGRANSSHPRSGLLSTAPEFVSRSSSSSGNKKRLRVERGIAHQIMRAVTEITFPA